MTRVAITGGIAEGKSTVLAILKEAGYSVASADEVSRTVVADPEVQSQIARLVGQKEPVSPAVLRAAIATDPALRRSVNAVTHPRILAGLMAVQAHFIEVPLLLEACLQNAFDRVWVVVAGSEVQRARLMDRYKNAPFIEDILASQLPSRVKQAFADYIIRTNDPLNDVRRCVLDCARHEFG